MDFDYRGSVGVILFNHSDVDFVGAPPRAPTHLAAPLSTVCAVKKGDRVAQLILEKIATPPVVEVCAIDSCAMPTRADVMRRWMTWTRRRGEREGSGAPGSAQRRRKRLN